MLLDKIIDGIKDDRNTIDKFIEVFRNLQQIPILVDLVTKLREEVKQIKMDLSGLSAAFSTFTTDFGKFRTDLTTFLGTVVPADPAQQAQIDSFVQQMGEFDNTVKQMDESLKLPAPNPPGGGV